MKLPYFLLLLKIDQKVLRKIITTGLTHNDKIFREIKRNIPRKIVVPGFNAPTKVPFASAKSLVGPIIKNELFGKPDLANLFLKGWYESNTALCDAVRNRLSEQKYEALVPTFEDLEFQVDALNREDVAEEPGYVYFRPGGKKIAKFDEEEATIMAALLGWFILSKEAILALQPDETSELLNESEEPTEIDVLITVENEEIEDIDNSSAETPTYLSDNTTENITDQPQQVSAEGEQNIFLDLDKLFLQKCESIDTIKVSLKQGIIPDTGVFAEIISSLKIELQKLADKLDYPDTENLTDLNQLKVFYHNKLQEENQKTAKNHEIVKSLLVKAAKISIKDAAQPDYLQKILVFARECLNNIDNQQQENEEWFKAILQQEHFLNHLVFAVESSVQDSVDDTLVDFHLDSLKKSLNAFDGSIYEPLSRMIIRGKLFFTDEKPTQPPEGDKQDVKPENPENETPVVDKPDHSHVQTDKPGEVADAQVTDSAKDDEASHSAYEGMSKEDISILKLLENDEPYLAHHLAICYENKGVEVILSSALLENLALSTIIRTESGQVATIMASNLEAITLNENNSKQNELYHNLLFASLLRPSIFAFNISSLPYLLVDVKLGKYKSFEDLRGLIYEFITQRGHQINPDGLNLVYNQEALDEKRLAFRKNLKEMLERSSTANFNTANHGYSGAYRKWVRPGGIIHDAVSAFLKDENIIVVQELLDNRLSGNSWQDAFYKEVKSIVGNNRNVIENRRAKGWIVNHIDKWKDLLSEGTTMYTNSNNNHDESTITEVFQYISQVKGKINLIEESLENMDSVDIFDAISSKYLSKALNNLKEALSGHETFNRPDVIELKYRPLLNISYYHSSVQWKPETYDDNLAKSIQEHILELPMTHDAVLQKHKKDGNYEAYNRILSYDDVSGIEPITKHDQRGFSNRLEHAIHSVRTKIERGCVYGFISNGKRNGLLSLISNIAAELNNENDGLNYPLQMHKLSKIEEEIEKIKAVKIKEYAKYIDEAIAPGKRTFLEKHLNDGNIVLFNETLQRSQSSLSFSETENFDHLKEFLNVFLSGNDGQSINLAIEAANKKATYSGTDYGTYTMHSREQIQTGLENWVTLKNNRKQLAIQDFEKYTTLLNGLGFIGIEKTDQKKEQLVVYFDFKCDPIKGRIKTPLPAFGSFANGKYRLVCILKDLGEEDLVEEIIKVTPETERAVIVFHFYWMDKSSRLELFRQCKSNRQEFLLLDEAMLLYLYSIKENRFPVFVRIAAPFSYSEPYQTGASNLPEEMFYGRLAEIIRLKSHTGDYSCLMYGGRQLGKTVLQKEVVRQFNNPEKNQYAEYIDLRFQGIGAHHPIEYIKDVLILNLQDIKGLVPDNLPHNIGLHTLMEKFEPWFNENSERRLILFLDEADKFLEQDAALEWKYILPIKGLMEKTNKRFKVVFSGLHDVRRTITIPNNPLAHLGEPICVGPMLDNKESAEAYRLVKLPIQTLGYEFESEDLVLLILSHCNWYPSLIQEFCVKLLEKLRDNRQINILPVIITEKDVSHAYERSRDRIKEKFKLTLGLDERYNVLANVLAEYTLERPEVQIEGVSVEEVTNSALISWKEGFDNANPRIDIRNLMSEMVDLGVLRNTQDDYYALRTANLLEMIGSRDQIAEYLYLTEKTLPAEFKRDISRIIYRTSSRTDAREKRSPFSASYFDIIANPDNKTIIFRGSECSGLGYIEEFLCNRSDVHVQKADPEKSFVEAFELVSKSSQRKIPDDGKQILVFGEGSPFKISDIISARQRLDKRSKVAALFLLNPERYRSFLQKDNTCFEKFENQKINVVNMPLWQPPVKSELSQNYKRVFQPLKDWFGETGCNSVRIDSMFQVTGAWHSLIDQYHERIHKTPELWEAILNTYAIELNETKEDILVKFGIEPGTMRKLLENLCEWDGLIQADEFIHSNELISSPNEREHYLDYFRSLNIIGPDLKVDGVIKKLVYNG